MNDVKPEDDTPMKSNEDPLKEANEVSKQNMYKMLGYMLGFVLIAGLLIATANVFSNESTDQSANSETENSSDQQNQASDDESLTKEDLMQRIILMRFALG